MQNTTERDNRLEAAGWRSGTAAEFLGMTPQEAAMLEIRFGLMKALRDCRKRAGLTQAEVAERIGSGQARIAKMENGDGRATVDLLIRAAMAAGANRDEIAAVFATAAEVAGVPSQIK